MLPYNFIDLVALDKQNSRFLAGQKFQLGAPPGVPNTINGAPSQPQPCEIQVNSTLDADIVLRRVIEDRAAILALKSRAATNEAELAKAKKRQGYLAQVLNRRDQEVADIAAKAKLELAQYNENSREYIKAFLVAFAKGSLDLPKHPFVPSLNELEQALERRKATLIEKVQCDDRVKRLEYITSKENVEIGIIKANEEAFLQAIEVAKKQYSDSCGIWLNRLTSLLSTMPQQAQRFDTTKVEGQASASPTPSAPQVLPPPVVFRPTSMPPKKRFERSAKRSIESLGPAPAVRIPDEEAGRHKRQKTGQPTPSPPSANDVVNLCQSPSDAQSSVMGALSLKSSDGDGPSLETEISMAEVLTSLHESHKQAVASPQDCGRKRFVVPEI